VKHHIRIHGTYPFDGEKSRWIHVKNISFEEACELTRVPEATRAMWPSGYPWLNKGYVVLGAPKDGPALTSLQAGMLEGAYGELGLKNWPDGVQAVYLHDGKFSVIQLRK
jgi:hypothetical protein